MTSRCPCCGGPPRWQRPTVPTAFSSKRVACEKHFLEIARANPSEAYLWEKVPYGTMSFSSSIERRTPLFADFRNATNDKILGLDPASSGGANLSSLLTPPTRLKG